MQKHVWDIFLDTTQHQPSQLCNKDADHRAWVDDKTTEKMPCLEKLESGQCSKKCSGSKFEKCSLIEVQCIGKQKHHKTSFYVLLSLVYYVT